MESAAERAVAIVGVGAILPDAPNAPAFWQNIVDKRYSITRSAAGALERCRLLRPRPNRARTRPTARSAAGCAASSSTGSASASRRRSPPPWTRASSGRSRSPPRRWPTTATPTGRWTPRTHRRDPGHGHGRRTALSDPPAHLLPRVRRRRSSACDDFQQLPDRRSRQAILERWHERIEQRLPADHRRLDAGRAGQHRLRAGRQCAQPARPQLHHRRRLRLELCRHRRGRRAARAKRQCDAVIAGGVDRNMGASTFVKFCKIGALSATGTRPFGDGADGFVMGEGAAAFSAQAPGRRRARRRQDLRRDPRRGRLQRRQGQGHHRAEPDRAACWPSRGPGRMPAWTRPRPRWSRRTAPAPGWAMWSRSRAWPRSSARAERGSIALGSVKSNIGHLKAGAGAAGLLKTVLALHDKVLPPTLQLPNGPIRISTSPRRRST